MKALFLDFDGVLNVGQDKPSTTRMFDPPCIAQLNRILASDDDIHIIISSSWRYQFVSKLGFQGTLLHLKEFMIDLGIEPQRVVGFTPLQLEDTSRSAEIVAWLRLHPGVTQWVALDDDRDILTLPAGNVVRTDKAVGITPERADEVLVLFAAMP